MAGFSCKTDVSKYLRFKKPTDVFRALCPMYDYGDDYNTVIMYLTPDGNSLSYYPLLRSYHNQTAVPRHTLLLLTPVDQLAADSAAKPCNFQTGFRHKLSLRFFRGGAGDKKGEHYRSTFMCLSKTGRRR